MFFSITRVAPPALWLRELVVTKLATHKDIQSALKKLSSPAKAKASAWFFKTDKGQYGHGDIFLGVTVPDQRKVARVFRNLPIKDIVALLKSPIHEHRLTALFILDYAYKKAYAGKKAGIVKAYLAHRKYVNNWDLVDSSAPQILGSWLLTHPRSILYKLSASKNLWDKRIAIVTTQAFMRNGEFQDTLQIAELLLKDTHDLIRKATGWMLREVGNRNPNVLKTFLLQHARHMPRTMLRYAIEKFPQDERKRWLQTS